ncbi:galactose-1-epimerase [Vibrio profundum]|uniref:galactose-1-epimerase n=1 Tax=Vibrio profundum TaxID=2910247 RepID=UPI003D10FE90
MTTEFGSMTSKVAFDGKAAQLVKLRNASGLSIVVMDIGATWLSCQLPLSYQQPLNGQQPLGCDADSTSSELEYREVLLGVNSMTDFATQQVFLGATVGRYANRIAGGRFFIKGDAYQVDTNQAGNCLHGGADGFDKRRWTIAELSDDKVVMSLHSPDGDQGFPGALEVSVCYQVTADNSVSINYYATTDTATPVNLTNHAYFNLNPSNSNSEQECVLDHTVEINAEQYLPTNEVGIPLDKPVTVSDTSFDFRQPKTLRQELLSDAQQNAAKGYDHSFVLPSQCRPVSDGNEAYAAKVISDDQRVTLTVFTDKPAMQLYSGNWLAGTPNRCGGQYADYAGLALETQFLPDAPNHPEWEQPECILQPDNEYRYHTRYHFTVK